MERLTKTDNRNGTTHGNKMKALELLRIYEWPERESERYVNKIRYRSHISEICRLSDESTTKNIFQRISSCITQ